jgi:YidC/Oxa1 family membrane protein insertase
VQFHKLFSQVFLPDSGWAWGLSIVFMTVIIRAALIPLFRKQMKSMLAMQRLQPEMKKIQDKFKKQLERANLDPARKQQLQQERQQAIMGMYREHKVNPLASCLPLLVQSPFFAALYRLLYNVANNAGKAQAAIAGAVLGFMTPALVDSANKAHIFGAPISAHFNTPAATLKLFHSNTLDVRTVIISMTAVYVITQFITQRQMVLKNSVPDNPMVQQQRMMMWIMPPLMAIFCLIAPLGVLLYLLTTNFWTMGQQFYMLHNAPQPGSKAHEAHLARKAEKERRKALAGGSADAITTAANDGDVRDVVAVPQDAAPKPQRNQPVRNSRSNRKR